MTAYEIRISDWSSDVCSSDLMSSLWRVADGIIRAGAAWHGQRRTDVIARPAGDFLSAERGPSGTHQPATDDAAVADGRSKGVDPDGRDLCRLHAGGRAGAHRGGRAGDAADDPRDLFLPVGAARGVGGAAARRQGAAGRLQGRQGPQQYPLLRPLFEDGGRSEEERRLGTEGGMT